MKPILMLIPSINRPSQLADCIASHIRWGTGKADILTLGGPGGVVAAFNSVSHDLISDYYVIGLSSDDIRIQTANWDDDVINALHGKSGLVYGRDGYQNENLCTHPFVTSDIFRALGFILPPKLHHFYGDNFLMDLLKPLGLIHYLPSLFTEHLHPDAGKSPVDATYVASRRWFVADTEAYRKYKTEQLDFDRQRVKQLLGL